MVDAPSMNNLVEDLESKDTKRRLQGLDILEQSLRQTSPAEDSWKQVVAPLVRTLRDNNFKVCRVGLTCLESLVGHVDSDISPFLSTIIPAVVECFGISKSAVQEKGIDFLLAISSPVVNGARDTITALDPHFRHKNWRVREKLVVFLGRAVEVDGAGVMGRPPAALAGILADALNDSASQVRQAALVAAGTLVELTGESLLTQLEQRGVRNAQLASLRLKSVQRDGGSNPVQTPSAAGRGPVSPAVVGLRQTAALRKPLRPAAGTTENAPTPAAVRSGGGGGGYSSSPAAVGSPSWLSDGGEDSAFSALEPLVPVKVCTERDVRREVEAAKACLEHSSDWQGWVGAMRRLAGVALGGAAEEFPALLVGLVRASVQEMVGHKVSENRSAVAREACRCVAVLARCLADHFGALAELWLPELLRNTTRAVVVAAAGDEAARAIFGCTTAGFARLLPCLIDTARNKSAAIRRRCLDYIMLALARWGDVAFDRYLPQLRNMIATAVGDADGSTRATARRAFWVLKKRFPELSQSIMDSLSPSMQRHVLREDREFDVDAFVKAANAAAEDPQPALGECTKERGVAAAGSCPASVNPSPNSHPSSSTAATRRMKDGQFSSAPNFAVAAASIGSGVERISQPPRFSASTTVGIVRTSNPESGGSGGGSGNSGHLLRSARSKVDRVGVGNGSSSCSNGVGGGGAAGGGEGGMRVMRPGGGAPTRKARGKATPQQVKDDDGGAMDSGRVTPSATGALRVPCGNAAAAVAFNNGAAEAMVHHGGGTGGDHPSAGGGAQRVVRKPMLTASTTGVATAVDSRGAAREGFSGGGGIAAGRVAGRQRGESPRASTADGEQQQRHRRDADEGRGGELADIGSVRPLREVAGPVVLDRKELLRKMDSLVEQAGLPHWAARVEALEGLLKLLTVEANGDGGRIVLESRAAARRLESMIAKRLRDVHFKVSSTALKLFGGLVEEHPDPTAGHADALLPLVFPSLADTKEPVRLAASRALDACRAAYPSNDLCAALCPRVLEFAPGRARTGLLEFLIVLVPHSAKYLSGQGHIQALTQRVAAALVQSPPPMSWDGGLGDSQGGPTSAGVEASAAIRLLTALFHVDREAFVKAVTGAGVGRGGSLPPESAAAVRRALAHSCPGVAELVSSSPVQQSQEQKLAHTAIVTSHTHSQWASVAAPVTVNIETDGAKNECDSRGGKAVPVGVSLSLPSVPASKRITTEDSENTMINVARIGTEGDLNGCSRNGSNRGEAMAREERRPLASVTLRHSGNAMQGAVVNTLLKDKELFGSRPASAKPGMENRYTATSSATSNSNVSPQSPPLTGEREALDVARRLISGLSPGARSNQKVEALSSLRALADGEGVGGHEGFWPRYFGQVLTLLLDGAAAASTRAGRRGSSGERPTGTPKSPSRRHALFRAKYLQGVRCLAARRGALFVGYTETVTERLVEIGAGDPCVVVRCEVEACMVDLVPVLDPPRFLAALTPLLFVGAEPDYCGRGGGAGQSGIEFVDSAATTGRDVLAQCVVLGALRALTPCLSSPCLLGALGAGPLMEGLGAALEGRDMEARRGSVMVFVEIYQVLEEALLPFLSGFPTCRLKLITMYIEQRRARDNRAAAGAKANVSSQWARSGGGPGFGEIGRGARVLTPTSSNVFKPMR